MKFKATFHKSEQSFRSEFGKVYEVGDRGYNDGYADGTQKGFTDGYEKCTEDMQDDLQAKYDEGYNNCTKDMQDDLQAKYDEGYAAGKAEAGGGSDTYGVEYMLTALPFLNKVEWTTTEPSYDEHWENPHSREGYGNLITFAFGGEITLAIIPPWVTEVQTDSIGQIKTYVIFTSKTPPIVHEQGYWAEWGLCEPPIAIFVPDEALEAYKNTPNLSEFADIIKPLSEYNGEGYYGGKL